MRAPESVRASVPCRRANACRLREGAVRPVERGTQMGGKGGDLAVAAFMERWLAVNLARRVRRWKLAGKPRKR